MGRYDILNDEQAKAMEAEAQRQQEALARLEAEQAQRRQQQRQEADQRGYAVLHEVEQRQLGEKQAREAAQQHKQEQAEHVEKTKQQMATQAQDMTRPLAASHEAGTPARTDALPREPEPPRAAATSRGYLEFTPEGTRYRPNAPRTPSAPDQKRHEATAAKQSRPDSLDKAEAATAKRLQSGKEFTEAFYQSVARKAGQEKTSRGMEHRTDRTLTGRDGRGRGDDGRD